MFIENQNVNLEIQTPKLNFYIPDMPRRLRRSLLKQNAEEEAPSSCPGQK